MAVKIDGVYYSSSADVEVSSLLTDDQIRDQLIAALEAGKTWAVATAETLSAATGAQTKPVPRVAEIAAQLKSDAAALQGVSPVAFASKAEFDAALAAAAQILPVAEWSKRLYQAHGLADGDFAALKAKLTPEA